mmetsp:Transcript_5894/g.12308  ORF Transcript_5894/g.12308 Transcript_5894/m.12308 type:complete len:246 (+) Transcript_5894:181-918(+)
MGFVGVHGSLHSLILGLIPLPALVHQHRGNALPLQRVQGELPHGVKAGEGTRRYVLMGIIGHVLGLVRGVVDPVPEARKRDPYRQVQKPAEQQPHPRAQSHGPLCKRRLPDVTPQQGQENHRLDGHHSLLTQRSDPEVTDIQGGVVPEIPASSSKNTQKSGGVAGVLPVQTHTNFAHVVQDLALGILGSDNLVAKIPRREHSLQQRQIHRRLRLPHPPYPLLVFKLGAELRCHLAPLVDLLVSIH